MARLSSNTSGANLTGSVSTPSTGVASTAGQAELVSSMSEVAGKLDALLSHTYPASQSGDWAVEVTNQPSGLASSAGQAELVDGLSEVAGKLDALLGHTYPASQSGHWAVEVTNLQKLVDAIGELGSVLVPGLYQPTYSEGY